MALPNTAMKTNRPTTASPKRPRQVPSRRSRTVPGSSSNSGCARTSIAAPACSPLIPGPSCRLHPRVEVEVQAVGEQVGQDHPGREDQERPLEHREVLVLDRLEAELAEA